MARYEDKFLVPLSSLSAVENFFDSDLVNFNKPYPSRFVSSLYYDTVNLTYAKQNADGNGLRSKVRIRFYNKNLENSNLEVKYKQYLVGKKLTIPLPIVDRIPAAASVYDRLKCFSELDLSELRDLCPKVLISYKRKYWTSRSFQGVRITLDSCISAKEITDQSPLDSLFDFNVPFQDICVLEVKYDSQENICCFKEYFQEHLELRRSRFSKYFLGLIFTSQLTMI